MFRCLLHRALAVLLPGAIAAASLALAVSVSAQEPADQVQAQLAAGEFGPALAAAKGVPDHAQRDAILGKIAAAQAAAGAREGSLGTAAQIKSDLTRFRAVNGESGQGGMFGRGGLAGRGGGVQADFDSLIELITTTIAPESWVDVGGPGSIKEFATGVCVDPTGLMKKLAPQTDRSLAMTRRQAAAILASGNPRRSSALRKISLTRLEREAQLLHAMGRQPDESMLNLAGLVRIKYVFFYPETSDVVLAGPAGDWRHDLEGRVVDVEKGRPVVQLDDLVVVLRNSLGKDPQFGCSIVPTKAGLASAQAVSDKWSASSLRPGQRDRWLKELRDGLGQQDIEYYGIDPRTRAARVIVEADYRMKLVGMGLEEGTLGVSSYLGSIEVAKGQAPPPMSVLRWWFTLNYQALKATPERDGFEIRGTGVQVLSENEFLTQRGDRVHTGKSDELTAKFADSFTNHFEALATKYPVYADMRNIFDLALVAALVKSHDLPGQAGWNLTHFGPDGGYEVALGVAPARVDSVVNHRVFSGKHVVAGVSGGVTVDPRKLASRDAVQTAAGGEMTEYRKTSAPTDLPKHAWWWD
ncbi:MAG: DUF1598 domain-containing protein [Planctomycetaceae bacterium]|nr:DUF1598 domain-containing protein [Planctomycetaceae bacterium]